MAVHGAWIELEGYATAVSAPDRGRRELFLHAGSLTLRVLIDRTAELRGFGGPDDMPLGPAHRLRVRGRVEGDPLLPVLRADRLELLESGDCREGRPDSPESTA